MVKLYGHNMVLRIQCLVAVRKADYIFKFKTVPLSRSTNLFR